MIDMKSRSEQKGSRRHHGCESGSSARGDAGERRARTDDESETLILRAAGSVCGSERMWWPARRMERGGCRCRRFRGDSLEMVERDCLRVHGGRNRDRDRCFCRARTRRVVGRGGSLRSGWRCHGKDVRRAVNDGGIGGIRKEQLVCSNKPGVSKAR